MYGFETILWTKAKKGTWPPPAPIAISSSMPRYGPTYTLTVRARGIRSPHAKLAAVLNRPVTAWIHETGELEDGVFCAEVTELLKEFLEGGCAASGRIKHKLSKKA